MVPIIYGDVNFHIYSISPTCDIFKNGELINKKEITYHSTNGYDYVLLETLTGSYRLFRLEFIMYNSFYPNTHLKNNHFKILHKDNNILNCNIDNLECCYDEEQWTEIIFPPEIKQNSYLVSSYGNFYSRFNNSIMILNNNKSGYFYIQLKTRNSKPVSIRAHRIVAKHFVTNPQPGVFTIVNHIDGDKHNNHVSNLEWVDEKTNSIHAVMLGLIESRNISSEEVNMVVSLLTDDKLFGSPKAVYESIDHDMYPHITYKIIKDIKLKLPQYVLKCTICDLNKLSFKNATMSKITTQEIDMIIDMLLSDKYNASPSEVYNHIDHDRFPNITRTIIAHIKYKSPQYIRNDSKYDLKNIKFRACKP